MTNRGKNRRVIDQLISLCMAALLAFGGMALPDAASAASQVGTAHAYIYTNKNCSMPQTGTAKTVFFLVDFPDYRNNDSSLTAQAVQKTYFSTDADAITGYYQRSSFGALTIKGTAYGWYTAKQNRSAYVGKEGDKRLYQEVVSYYQKRGVDFSSFDGDKDGVVDCVYLLFAGGDTGYDSDWWSYAGYLEDASYQVDGKTLGSYVKLAANDTMTAIHETGHTLGLWDYYHTDDKNTVSYGIGGHDMMDDNTGDHNALSKILLGWMTPRVVLGSSISHTISVSVGSSAKGECVVLFPDGKADYGGEYYVIEYLTADGLYAGDELLEEGAFRVLHVQGTDAQGRLQVSFVEADRDGSVLGQKKWERSDLFHTGMILSTELENAPYLLFLGNMALSEGEETFGTLCFLTQEQQVEKEQELSCDTSTVLLKKNMAYSPIVTDEKGVSINRKMSWLSVSPEIAQVSETGRITAKKSGHAVIIGTMDWGTKENLSIVIIDVYVVSSLKSISFSASRQTLYPGSKAKMTIMVNGVDLTDALKISWSVSNTRLSVNQKGTITANKVGLSTVKASLQGGIILTNQLTVNFSPLKVKAVQSGTKAVTVSWNQVKGATGYCVYRYNYLTKEDPVLVATIKKADTLSYTDKRLKKNGSYAYQVFAFDASQPQTVYSDGSSWKNVKLS